MVTKTVRNFRGVPNEEILNVIRGKASNPYKSRVPEATQANLEATAKAIMSNPGDRNEFENAFVNQIGRIVAQSLSWTNPLAKFKIGMLEWGDTIEEYYVGLAKAYTYDPDRNYMEEAIFGQEDNEVQSSFHKINRQEYYKVTVNDKILRRAFLDPTGLSKAIAEILASSTNADNLDEFIQTTSLFREYYDNDGFFKVQISDIASPASTMEQAKFALRRIHEIIYRFQFPSRHYNAAGMPVAAKPEELELFCTPGFKAAIDIEALASLFNVGLAEVGSRITIIPDEYWNIPGAQAMLTTKDFFVIADTLLETRDADNPVGLYRNYFLHHHQIISFSRFVPAVLFTTEEGDTLEPITSTVTSLDTIEIRNREGELVTNVPRGDFYDITTALTMDPVDALPTAVRYQLSGRTTSKTVLRQEGTLFVPHEEAATALTIDAIAVDDNTKVKRRVVNLSGPVLTLWPKPAITEEGTETP